MRAENRACAFPSRILVLLLACWGQASPAMAAGLRDLQDGWLLSTAEAVRLLAGTASIPGQPIGPGNSRGAWICAGKTRLFDMPDLPVTALAGGWAGSLRGTHFLADFSWERTGGEIFLEDRKDFFLGFGEGTVLGLDWSLSGIWIEAEPDAAHTEAAGILVHRRVLRDGTLVRVGWRFDLGDPPPWFGSRGRRALGSLSLLRPDKGLGLGLALDRRGDGTPGLSLELSLGLSERFGLGLRADPPTGSLGPTTVWRSGPLLIRTCHVAHPDLGLTHRFSLTVGNLAAAGR